MQSNVIKRSSSNVSLAYFILKVFPFTKCIFDRYSWIEQFLNFGLVGVFNTLIAFLTYYIVISFNFHPQIAGIAGFIISVSNAWIMNKYWVFRNKDADSIRTPFKFFTVYIGNLFFGIFLTFILYDCLHFNKYILPVISLGITVPVNFILTRNWVFQWGKSD